MTDLPVFPEAYLPSRLVRQRKFLRGWDLATLENGQKVLINYTTRDIIYNLKAYKLDHLESEDDN
jgi:hypothetical protein